jgi:hypothetical protein
VRGQRLAFWGSQPGLELSTETPVTGKGAAPRRSLATNSTGRQLLARAGRRWSGQASAGVECDSHPVPSAAAGSDYSRVEGRTGALRTTVTQDLTCARWAK